MKRKAVEAIILREIPADYSPDGINSIHATGRKIIFDDGTEELEYEDHIYIDVDEDYEEGYERNWAADRVQLIGRDSKSFRGHDEDYRRMSLEWELYKVNEIDNKTDHYEVWIDGRWSDSFKTVEEAWEYIRVYGK